MKRYIVLAFTLCYTLLSFSHEANENAKWLEMAKESQALAMSDTINKLEHLKDAIRHYNKDAEQNDREYDTCLSWANALADLYDLEPDPFYWEQCNSKYALAANLNPSYAMTYFNWGVILYYQSKKTGDNNTLRTSIDKLARAVALDDEPDNAVEYLNMALTELLSWNSNFKFSNPALEQYETLQEKIAYLKTKEENLNEVELAIKAFEEAAVIAMDDYLGWYINGLFLVQLAKIDDNKTLWDDAFRNFKKVISLDPLNESAYTSYAYYLFDRARKTNDQAYLNKLMVISQEANSKGLANATIYQLWGRALLHAGLKMKDNTRVKLGVRAIEQSIELDTKSYKSYSTLAQAYEQLLLTDNNSEIMMKAADNYEKAVELNHDNFTLHQSAGDFFLKWAYMGRSVGLYLKAAYIYEKAHLLDPYNLKVIDNQANALMSVARLENNFPKYREHLLGILHRGEELGSQEAAFNLICVYSLLNETKDALDWMEKFFAQSNKYRMRMNMQRSDFTTDRDFDNIRSEPQFNSLLNIFL